MFYRSLSEVSIPTFSNPPSLLPSFTNDALSGLFFQRLDIDILAQKLSFQNSNIIWLEDYIVLF